MDTRKVAELGRRDRDRLEWRANAAAKRRVNIAYRVSETDLELEIWEAESE